MKRRCIPALLLVVLLVSCRYDYGDSPSEGTEDSRPDFTLHDLAYRVHLGDASRIHFTAESGDFHEGEHTAELTGVSFLQYAPDGELITRGQSESAVIDLHTENALLSGAVVIRAIDEELTITAEILQWHREEQVLSAPGRDLVTMEQDHGTMTRGRGFTADLYRREFQFTDDVWGVLNETP